MSYASLALAPWSTFARAWEPPVLLCLAGCTLGSTLFVVADVLSGYNATVFAYGQTASGKTFTMLVCWAPHGRVVGLAPGLRALCDRVFLQRAAVWVVTRLRATAVGCDRVSFCRLPFVNAWAVVLWVRLPLWCRGMGGAGSP